MRRARIYQIRIGRWKGFWEVQFFSPVTGGSFLNWYATWAQARDMAVHWVDFR